MEKAKPPIFSSPSPDGEADHPKLLRRVTKLRKNPLHPFGIPIPIFNGEEIFYGSTRVGSMGRAMSVEGV
jgi:hypothetical protein